MVWVRKLLVCLLNEKMLKLEDYFDVIRINGGSLVLCGWC